ncbi:MAG TPA: tRNA preQ1(34) S-adenosylmethionine ribosyltransferase-isomerase QueA [Steroidobacteraceae bacterium]|nr:tRNA preQ1(34) S-adenosylmethionine ribosyltransferase-isomerase QueA [Steroidobacteraceae bacterium]
MRRSDFHYQLPPELIAQAPTPERSASRLLALDGMSGEVQDLRFRDLPRLLRAGDLLVFNDTRVLNARLFARKPSGGQVELLLERLLGERRGLFQARASKPLRAGATLELQDQQSAQVLAQRNGFVELEFSTPLLAFLDRHGEVPLPPYIEHKPAAIDRERYQTIFAQIDGAVAAPTAGLHFDQALVSELESSGVSRVLITLHVGAGTFQPLRVENLDQHRMHPERVQVSAEACEAINATRSRGGRIVAVGTTVVRGLETAASSGVLAPYHGETELFIRPGYRLQVVDRLLTNFHLPESTLLMLVSAFGGFAHVMAAYAHAVAARYRFFSYGDAMFVTPGAQATGNA